MPSACREHDPGGGVACRPWSSPAEGGPRSGSSAAPFAPAPVTCYPLANSEKRAVAGWVAGRSRILPVAPQSVSHERRPRVRDRTTTVLLLTVGVAICGAGRDCLAAQEAGLVDVRAMGAQGDGSTDDRAAVQTAIDRAAIRGGRLRDPQVFPPQSRSTHLCGSSRGIAVASPTNRHEDKALWTHLISAR